MRIIQSIIQSVYYSGMCSLTFKAEKSQNYEQSDYKMVELGQNF